MDTKEKLLDLFDTEAGIYALQIIPSSAFGYGINNPNMPETYSGIHFVDTPSLLSICRKAPELISIVLDKHGDVVEPDNCGGKPDIYFESIEIGIWCKALLRTGDASIVEHLDIPFVYKNDDFNEFEKLGNGALSKLTTLWCADQAHQHANTLISAQPELPAKMNSAFYGYYNALQGIVLAKIGKFVHEATAFAEVAPTIATLYPVVIKRMMIGGTLSRRELSAAHFEILKLLELLAESDGESDLPDKPSEEIIESFDKELLRLRKTLI